MSKTKTIKDLRQGLVNKNFSCEELIIGYLKKIEKKDGEINALREIYAAEALEQAKIIDQHIAKKKKMGVLSGIPVILKDNLLYSGHVAAAGSKILEHYQSVYSATAVKKLAEAGAIFIGRANMDEFAMGSSTENSAFGPTRNPRDLERVPGGSSGGSAAAVAADFCVAALGSDTGGSIRQPAAFCGIVGLKPTYGAVSRYGLIAMASSLDQIGPLTNSVADAQEIFNVIKGPDIHDATTLTAGFVPAQKITKTSLKKLRFGVPKEYFADGLDTGIKENVEKAIAWFVKQGAEVKEISLPQTSHALPAYYLIQPAEVSSNLARFDGIRYGLSKNNQAKNLEEIYNQSRATGFGQESKRRVILGTFALSAGYFDAYYKKAKQVQAIVRQDFLNAFQQVDLLLAPTTPTTAFKFGEKTADPVTMYLSDIFTVSANLAGIPAISLQAGLSQGLPVGLQILGRPFEESLLLSAAEYFEQNF